MLDKPLIGAHKFNSAYDIILLRILQSSLSGYKIMNFVSVNHPLDLEVGNIADGLSVSVEDIAPVRNNVDDCFGTISSFSTATGCAGSFATFTTIVSCGS